MSKLECVAFSGWGRSLQLSTKGTRSGTSYGRTQLGDEVTWSDITDIQLKHFVFWSNNKVIELECVASLGAP